MKSIFLYIVIVLFTFSQNAAKAKENGLAAFNRVEWGTELSRALSQAKIEDRNVIVMVEDVKCKWCIKMKRGALSDIRVQEILKEYILVRVLRSNKSESNQLNGFGGTIPSFFFITKEHETVENIVGYFRADDFLGYIKEIRAEGF